ncbi:MAG: DUF1674 domain-containing protein [Geminicoccaceae bacterium]
MATGAKERPISEKTAPDKTSDASNAGQEAPDRKKSAATDPSKKQEIGGPKGPEPTRYGDWEKGGRCIDF